MNTYKYAVSGTGAGEQTWQIDGQIQAEAGNLPSVFDQAMRETFGALTSHKAVFGQPGVGCSGPYRITRLLIEMVQS